MLHWKFTIRRITRWYISNHTNCTDKFYKFLRESVNEVDWCQKRRRTKNGRVKREIELNYCFSEPADHIKHTLTRRDEHPKERFDIFPGNSSSLPLDHPSERMLFIFSSYRGKIPLPFPSFAACTVWDPIPQTNDCGRYFVSISSFVAKESDVI